MYKLIGLIFGSFLGPFGAIIGLLTGTVIDLLFSKEHAFYFKEFSLDELFFEAFPMLAAFVTKTPVETKEKVIATKEISVSLFGTKKAQEIMKKYKRFIEKGFNYKTLFYYTDQILYLFDYRSKLYLLNLLFIILKKEDSFTLDEISAIEKIAYSIGINSFDFEELLKTYRKKGANYQKKFEKEVLHESNPYEILGLPKSATNEEIKKKYHELCKKYHPDVTANLSEKEKEEAKIKIKEIRNAYDKIKKERNIK